MGINFSYGSVEKRRNGFFAGVGSGIITTRKQEGYTRFRLNGGLKYNQTHLEKCYKSEARQGQSVWIFWAGLGAPYAHAAVQEGEALSIPPRRQNQGLFSPRPGAILRAKNFPHAACCAFPLFCPIKTTGHQAETVPPTSTGSRVGSLQLGGEHCAHAAEKFPAGKSSRRDK